MQSIICGSIRAPDRLHAAELIADDRCRCKAGKKTRATTEHVFWKCHLYDDIRQPYLDKLNTIKRNCARDNYEAYLEIMQNIELPCFRNCGIINGNDNIRKAHVALPQIDPRLLIRPESEENSNITTDHDTHEYINHGDNNYMIAYTDGSASRIADTWPELDGRSGTPRILHTTPRMALRAFCRPPTEENCAPFCTFAKPLEHPHGSSVTVNQSSI